MTSDSLGSRKRSRTPSFEMEVVSAETRPLVEMIRHGDRVTITTPHGQLRTGTAVMKAKGGIGWVLNGGGQHGTPLLATDGNIVNVCPARCKKEKTEN